MKEKPLFAVLYSCLGAFFGHSPEVVDGRFYLWICVMFSIISIEFLGIKCS